MKKISEWLQAIEDSEVRGKALLNHEERESPNTKWADVEVPDLMEAIYQGFDWETSNEGFGFWEDYVEKLSHSTQPEETIYD